MKMDESMMYDDLISVIIPVYNVEKYLRQALDSIICQTYKNLEILIINDGSTDNSATICDEYCTDSRVKVFHRQNEGVTASRQFGVDHCNGTFFVTIDSDDYVSPYFVEKLYEAIKANNADIAVCGVSCFTDGSEDMRIAYMPNCPYQKLIVTNELLSSDLYKMFLDFLLTDSWNKMHRTQFVCETNVRYELLKKYNGSELKMENELALHCPVYCVCRESLLFHRMRHGSLVQRKNNCLQEGFEVITESLLQESDKLGLSLKKQLSNIYFWLIGNIVSDIIYRGGNICEKHERFRTMISKHKTFINKHSAELVRHKQFELFKLGDSSICFPAFVLSNPLWLDIASIVYCFLIKVKYWFRRR